MKPVPHFEGSAFTLSYLQYSHNTQIRLYASIHNVISLPHIQEATGSKPVIPTTKTAILKGLAVFLLVQKWPKMA